MSSGSKLPSVTSPPWSASTKRIVSVGLLLLLVLALGQVSGSVWRTLVVALVLGYLLSPLVTFFEQRLGPIHSFDLRRTLAVLMTWILVLGLVALVVGLIVPATVAQLRQFAQDLPDLFQQTENDLRDMLSQPISIGNFTLVPWEEIESTISPSGGSSGSSLADALQNATLSVADSALNVVGGALSFLLTLTIMLVMIFYLMRDGPLFVVYLVDAVPESYQGDIQRLMHELGRVWNAYLRGQLLLNLSVGFATYIVALVLGLPQPLLLALVAGFLELIPNIGPTLAMIPALLFAFTTNSATISGLDAGLMYALIVGASYIAIQQLEAMLLVPRILGSSLDLHPIVVLVAVTVGASLAGILGVILAAPITATLRVLLRYVRGKLLDEEVFPSMPAYSIQQRGFVYRLIRFLLSKRFPVLTPESPHDWQSLAESASVEQRETLAR